MNSIHNPGALFPDDPTDNEIVLWRLIQANRAAMVGQGGPFANWPPGFSDNGTGIPQLPPFGNGCAMQGQPILLGANGELTVDNNPTLFIDSFDKRVGINTCFPQYTLDVFSVECGNNVFALHNSSDIAMDLFPAGTGPMQAVPPPIPPPVRILAKAAFLGTTTTGTLSFQTEGFDSPSTPLERFRVDTAATATAAFGLSGAITPAQIVGATNDYDPVGNAGATVFRLSTNASQNLSGIARPFAGRLLVLENVGTQNIVLVNQAGSVPINQFVLPGAANYTLSPGNSVTLIYDIAVAFWRMVSSSSGALTGSGVAGQVTFWTGTTSIGGDTSFLWDNTNKFLGIRKTPAVDLDILNKAGSSSVIQLTTADAVGNPSYRGLRAQGTPGAPTAVTTDNILNSFAAFGYDGTTYQGAQARITQRAGSLWTVANRETYQTFETTPSGSTVLTERFRIGSAGQWGIGGATFGTAGQTFQSGGAAAAPTWSFNLVTPLVTSYIDFTAISAPANPTGTNLRMYAQATQGFTRIHHVDANGIDLTIGRDVSLIVRNVTGVSLTDGQVVYVSGTTGQIPQVSLAKSDSLTTLPAIGFVMGTIVNNAFGYVHTQGIHSGLDTSAFVAGDRVFVSATVAGGIQHVKPVAPFQSLGTVLNAGVSGTMLIEVSTPTEQHTVLDADEHGDTVAHVPVKGDIIVANNTPKWDALPVATDGWVLTLDSTQTKGVKWAAAPAMTPHALLDASQDNDTVAHAVVLGDLIFGNATPKWDALAGNITTTRKFLRQTGTGAVSAAPVWDTLVAGDVAGLGTPDGAWTAVTYNAGNFGASGSMVWTVDVGDQVAYKWKLIGTKTLALSCAFNATSISGTPSNQVTVKIPNAYVAQGIAVWISRITDNGTDGAGLAFVTNGATVVTLQKIDGSNMTASTNNTVVQFSMIFEIQ